MEINSRKLPKTLILSAYAPPSPSGSGLMMYNLLSHLDPASYVILTSNKSTDQALEKYRLGCKYYYYGTAATSFQFIAKQDTLSQKIRRFIKNFPITKFFAAIVLILWLPIRIARLATKIIRDEQVERIVVYTDIGLVLFAGFIASLLSKKPLVVYCFDLYVGNKQPWAFKLLAYILEPLLFKRAKTIIVMCEGLEEIYKKRFNTPIEVIHNPIQSIPVVTEDYFIQPKQNSTFKIAFIGSVYWAQAQALELLAIAVRTFPKGSIELLLYTPHNSGYLEGINLGEDEWIKHASCPPDQALAAMRQADLLFVGLSFHTPFPDLINSSAPGKFSEYLISGRPILVAAPKSSFIASHAKQFKAAFVLNEHTVEKYTTVINELISNASLKSQLVKSAYSLAKSQYDGETNAQKFASVLNNIN